MGATRVPAVPCFAEAGSLAGEMLARVLLVVCFLGGCGVVVRTTPLDVAAKPRRPRPASEVEVYAAGRPTYPFVDFALMEGWLVAPANIAPEVARLPAGSSLAAAGPAERGWYRVRLSDGRLGYAPEGELRPAPQAP